MNSEHFCPDQHPVILAHVYNRYHKSYWARSTCSHTHMCSCPAPADPRVFPCAQMRSRSTPLHPKARSACRSKHSRLTPIDPSTPSPAACLPATRSSRLPACLSFSPAACLHLFQPGCMPASLSAQLLACLPAPLPAAKPIAHAASFALLSFCSQIQARGG